MTIFYIYQNNRCWQINAPNKANAIEKWKSNAAYLLNEEQYNPIKVSGKTDKIMVLTKLGKLIKV